MSKQRAIEAVYGLHSSILETGTDHTTRRMYLYGVIDDAVAYRFAVGFNQLDQLDGDIHIHLSSYGGEIESGLAIFDTIKMSRNRVVIFGIGPVMSMGVIILQAADLRVLAPNARMCVHDGFASHKSSLLKLASMGKEAGSTVDRMTKILSERTGRSTATIKRMMETECFMSSDEAVEAGFADVTFRIDHKKKANKR